VQSGLSDAQLSEPAHTPANDLAFRVLYNYNKKQAETFQRAKAKRSKRDS
jgi:hypothetical protein